MTSERTDPDQRALSLALHGGNGFAALSALPVEVIDSNDGLALEEIAKPCHWTLCSILSYWKPSCKDALDSFQRLAVPLILCDKQLAGGSWQQPWRWLASESTPLLFLVTCGRWGERLWSEVLNLGGNDALATPFRLEEVIRHGPSNCYQRADWPMVAAKEVGA